MDTEELASADSKQKDQEPNLNPVKEPHEKEGMETDCVTNKEEGEQTKQTEETESRDVKKDEDWTPNLNPVKEPLEKEAMEIDSVTNEVEGEQTKQTIETESRDVKSDEDWTLVNKESNGEVTKLYQKDGRQEEPETKESCNAFEVNFYGDEGSERNSVQVEFLQEKGLKINDEPVSLASLRYATRRPYQGFPQRAAHCVVLSYSDKATELVQYCFLEMATAEETKQLSVNFEKLLQTKFAVTHKDTDNPTDVACCSTVNEQPIYFGKSEIKVKSIDDSTTKTTDETVKYLYEGRCIVVLDIECMAFYPVVDSKLSEPYRLMFWQEEGENTVEKILHYHGDKKIVFETASMSYEMPVIEEIVSQLHELQPKAKKVLADKVLLCEWVSKVARTRKTPDSAGPSLFPGAFSEYEAGASASASPAPMGSRGDYGQNRGADWNQAMRNQERENEEIERSVVFELQRELDKAVKDFEEVEDVQIFWISVEADINALLSGGTVPETDPFSGGLDPNSADHLRKAVNDVADQMKEAQYSIAISRIQAARSIFAASEKAEIQQFFHATDVDLLKKLYFRSLVQ